MTLQTTLLYDDNRKHKINKYVFYFCSIIKKVLVKYL
jgi:hypothetical protein